jgi:hypothetical protein
MKNILIVLFPFFVACSSPFLESGVYDVNYVYTESTDPFYQVGDTNNVQWDIEETNDGYTLQVVGTETIFSGGVVNGQVVIEFYMPLSMDKPECPDNNYLKFILVPGEHNTQFIGTADQILNLCVYSNPNTGVYKSVNWESKISATGERK